MRKKNSTVSNITKKPIEIPFCQDGKQLTVHIEEAYVGEVEGKNEILDYPLWEYMVEQIGKAVFSNRSKYISIPSDIYIGTRDNAEEAIAKDKAAAVQTILDCTEPGHTLEQVALPKDIKESLQMAVDASVHRNKLEQEWGLERLMESRAMVLNFYGKPGTGKTMAAEAVAASLGKKCLKINYAQLESKYVGETPKNIQNAFKLAKEQDAVLIFDEADSFLGKRLTEVKQSADYGVNITRSVLLMELEKFQGTVIFTTNLISNYDQAFKRRIFMSLEFPMPDCETRRKIWELQLPDQLPLSKGITAEMLADTYSGVSGADIRDMIFLASLHACQAQRGEVSQDDFQYAYLKIRGRYENGESDIKIFSHERIDEDRFRQETENNEEQ